MIKKYFGTDGIRGKVNGPKINGEMFFKFGLAAGTYFKNLKKNKQTAIIAKDTRLSGYTLEPALVSGLASAGMHIYTLGPLPTNGLAMLTKKMRANMGMRAGGWWRVGWTDCTNATRAFWYVSKTDSTEDAISLPSGSWSWSWSWSWSLSCSCFRSCSSCPCCCCG